VVLPELDRSGKVVRRYQLGPSELTGRAISSARANIDSNGQWLVEFRLNGRGSTAFDELAAKNVGKQVAIDLDGIVKSAPTIQQAEFNGRGQITGDFSEGDAKDLALVLRYGSLPVQLERQSVQTVSATLGKDSLAAGLAAGAIGLGLVALYMLIYYRALGLVVWLGLAVSAALMYSLVTFLGQTSGLALTLAGATGIIVSVGVTVDSYIVYFERLKDEVRAGKTVRSSVDRGFSRAYRTIVAADTSSFIGAMLLYLLTVGPVRGFAFFLGLSTLLDLFIAYFFTRPMVILLGRNRLFTEARWLGVARGLAAARPAQELA
jgi:preprotein translocase subunit SecD